MPLQPIGTRKEDRQKTRRERYTSTGDNQPETENYGQSIISFNLDWSLSYATEGTL